MNVKVDVGGGVDKFVSDLEKLGKDVEGISKRAVYAGADVIADAIRSNLQGLSTDGRLTDYEKEGMLEGLGIAPIKKNGQIIDTKIGMHGYNGHRTKKYPKGQPNALIARSVEKGTSFRKPQPFIKPAVERYKVEAENAMSAEFDRQVSKIVS